MFKRTCKILLTVIMAVFFIGGAHAAMNFQFGDIGDYGTWATDANREVLLDELNGDLNEFAPDFSTQLVSNYVPIEAKIGLGFINAMSHVAKLIDKALGRFAIAFIILMYIFWVALEAYNNMVTGWNVEKLGKEILIRTLKVMFWIAVLSFGPAELFMILMTPILKAGTLTADGILNGVAAVTGTRLPDTCAAIHSYVSSNIATHATIDAASAADLMCLPTRLSGYFTSGVALGWELIKDSIGTSLFLFVLGVGFIILFLVNAWKFVFMAFGVIADLFLAIIMLPFTAVAETVTKTSYKGIPGDVYNTFTGLFKAESLKEQINRVISAAIYFIVLSVVIAVCVALMSAFIVPSGTSLVPSISSSELMPLLITGFLIWHLAKNADVIAKDWGGSINDEYGKKLRSDVETLAKNIYKKGKSIYKLIKAKD